jgi:hypothetical protein
MGANASNWHSSLTTTNVPFNTEDWLQLACDPPAICPLLPRSTNSIFALLSMFSPQPGSSVIEHRWQNVEGQLKVNRWPKNPNGRPESTDGCQPIGTGSNPAQATIFSSFASQLFDFIGWLVVPGHEGFDDPAEGVEKSVTAAYKKLNTQQVTMALKVLQKGAMLYLLWAYVKQQGKMKQMSSRTKLSLGVCR